MKRFTRVATAVATVAVAVAAGIAHAKGKEDPDSFSGHGAMRDVWLLKGTQTPAKCGGPVGTSKSADGGTSFVCRVNGVPTEVEKSPPPVKGGKKG